MELTNKQKFVIDFLRDEYNSDFKINDGWVSPTTVGHSYGIKFLNKDTCHSSTGSPILKKLVVLGYVERSRKGWYRFVDNNR